MRLLGARQDDNKASTAPPSQGKRLTLAMSRHRHGFKWQQRHQLKGKRRQRLTPGHAQAAPPGQGQRLTLAVVHAFTRGTPGRQQGQRTDNRQRHQHRATKSRETAHAGHVTPPARLQASALAQDQAPAHSRTAQGQHHDNWQRHQVEGTPGHQQGQGQGQRLSLAMVTPTARLQVAAPAAANAGHGRNAGTDQARSTTRPAHRQPTTAPGQGQRLTPGHAQAAPPGQGQRLTQAMVISLERLQALALAQDQAPAHSRTAQGQHHDNR
jgi:hypothetical protein